MKKLSPISMLVITLLCLFIGSTVIIRPVSSLAQPPDPGSDDLFNGSEVESVQTEQSQRTALASNADGYLYALRDVDGGGNLIYGFEADALTGALTALPGFPVTTGGLGSSGTVSELMAFDATNSRLFVVNNGSDTISAYAVNRTDGSLTELSYSPFSIPTGFKGCLAVHPSGSPLVVGDTGSNVASFNVSADSATEASGSPFSTGDSSFSCAFSQNGSYVYAGGGGNVFSGFTVDAASGVLTPLSGSPFNSGASAPVAYTTDKSGRLFAANWVSNQVRGFTTSSGIPTGVSGNPFISGLGEAVHGVLHPAGYYMVADRAGNQVGVYEIAGSGSATTLTAVAGSPFASGGLFTDVLALNDNGKYLFAANGDSKNISSFSVDPGDGSLSGTSIQPIFTVGDTGLITGMAYAPPLSYVYLPIIISD